jgi:hypothetical protein
MQPIRSSASQYNGLLCRNCESILVGQQKKNNGEHYVLCQHGKVQRRSLAMNNRENSRINVRRRLTTTTTIQFSLRRAMSDLVGARQVVEQRRQAAGQCGERHRRCVRRRRSRRAVVIVAVGRHRVAFVRRFCRRQRHPRNEKAIGCERCRLLRKQTVRKSIIVDRNIASCYLFFIDVIGKRRQRRFVGARVGRRRHCRCRRLLCVWIGVLRHCGVRIAILRRRCRRRRRRRRGLFLRRFVRNSSRNQTNDTSLCAADSIRSPV